MSGVGELTPEQLNELKESSHRRVKRLIAGVGITLTIISILLVALSLTLGQKIDELGAFPSPFLPPPFRPADWALVGLAVDQKTRAGSAREGQVGNGGDFFLGAPPTDPPRNASAASSSSRRL